MDPVTTYLTGLDAPRRGTGEKLRSVVEAALPEATGAMWHGQPVWGLGDRPGKTPLCLVKAYPAYVTFGLWRGQDVADDSGRLVSGARRMSSVKLHGVDEIDPELFTGWLRAAYALETR
ncbi:DUF1801 domain-containing protein [Micromonospora sp. MA102]|uniref:DUF1801 domain-containing protein n=1 Tax=Micromonospora sp. MA102 TaxID=2952755 RepID=UPI0021C6D3D6|nr:DUF1801 domain-containing protein [Micromonospora sp. MA102]